MAKKESLLPQEVIETLGEQMQHIPSKNEPEEKNLGPPADNPINDSYSGTLDDAASLLLRQLDPSIRDYAFELADIILKIPRWQLVLGSILAQFESGTLQAPSILPSWSTIEVVSGTSTCQYKPCSKTFTPERYGQIFCSNVCGNLFRKEEIALINKRKAEELKMRRKMEEAEMGGSPA